MHIPNEMLNGLICPVSAVVAAAGLALTVRFALQAKHKPSILRFAAVAALIFAGQMINFPIQNGTSGHLLGGVLAAAILGVPFGVLALALVVTIQSLVFADGGILVLGTNILNMALLGSGIGGLLNVFLLQRGMNQKLSLLFASWFSVLIATLACSIELAVSGTITLEKVMPAMLGIHSIIGVAEALLTLCLVSALNSKWATSGQWKFAAPFLGSILIVTVLSPFASSYPDGLEWVAHQYGFLKEGAPLFVSPLAEYAFPGIGNAALSSALAGLIGVILVTALGVILAKLLQSNDRDVLAY